ncbi:MAG: DEAD/DEAH box helicase family protein, partial [Fusobacteriaceae bacterium]
MQTSLINNRQKDMYTVLKRSFEGCKEFLFIVSFIRFSGIQILLDILKEAEKKGIKGKIITTNYMNITEKKALEKLKSFSNLEIKFFDGEEKGFHPKSYIFIYEEETKIIVGSSNLSKGGLKSNVEWNSEVILKNENNYREEVLEEFDLFWKTSKDYHEKYFEDLDFEPIKNGKHKNTVEKIKPNYMQSIGLENLKRIRANGEIRALGVATTGTGKTYLAAFDVEREKPKRILFLVHREEILNSALKTFSNIISEKTFGKYTGTKKEKDADYLFATVQSVYNNLNFFEKNEFQYIILDEAHHSTGKTYCEILEYFKPNFLLGLTATPERADGIGIYDIFHGNIVMEIRMREALKEKLISPFNYFGISDIKEIDLSDLETDKMEEIAKRLMVNKRTDYILEKILYYGHSGKKRKGIGFCVNVEHAKYMAEEFKSKGMESIALTGENSSKEREEKIKELQNENNSLEFIFTVDIFNEGVDIPDINLILMLRPTDSPVIFLQQLGRGLRKFKNKEFLTVLDFIGNHKKSFLVALALTGNLTYDKESIRLAIKNDFKNLSSEVFISMDKVSKEHILNQIENENFNSVKYLKEEYMSFKNILKRVPNYLDFLNYEGAPNILKFILKYKSYYNFLKTIGEEESIFTEEQIKIVEQIERSIPIKRLNEFSIMNSLLDKEWLSVIEAEEELLKYVEKGNVDSLEHSFNYLSGEYSDDGEKRREIKLF